MIRTSFNDGWTVRPFNEFFNVSAGEEPTPITLPHDAMIAQYRDAEKVNGHKKSYFPEGAYEYEKKFFVPHEYKDKRMTLEFEGVYMNAMVYINNDFAGQHPYGYSNFYIKADRFLKYGEENEIKVVARTADDSRWYTGIGIYRDTKIMISNPVHIAVDGVKITTPEITNDQAIVNIKTEIENEGMNPEKTQVRTEIINPDGHIVATDTVPLTAFSQEKQTLHQNLLIRGPKLWDVDTPHLYVCRSQIVAGEDVLDEAVNNFGIRSLSLNAQDGLRMNGEVVKLRGACIHHDNGILGAATVARAEERRIEILKEAGFNAVRSAHNPMSKSMLEACDRLGMLVMDEAFDVWTQSKSDFDYALSFPTWWEKDIEAMIDKDFNHPSVIMYSIGNEITDTGSANGAAWSRKLANKIRDIDNTRYIINSINGVASVSGQINTFLDDSVTGDINALMTKMGHLMKEIQDFDIVKESTEESFATVDVAGYNYAENRYVTDKKLYPNRVICGSETFPKDIATNWQLVKENGHVIGDFTWTGWDYLGEVGIGKIEYEDTNVGDAMYGFYPYYSAYCGDIDLIGNRRPASFYREIVFGLRKKPYIAVQRPEHYGKEPIVTPWSWSDSVSSWSWEGYEGKPVIVEVYSEAEEVELFINGEFVGKKPTGNAHNFTAEFDTTYRPGEMIAVSYSKGKEAGRYVLKSAQNNLNLNVDVDRPKIVADDSDLAFINISLADDNGILKPLADRKISVNVQGAGELFGLGSGNPKTEENYFDPACTTFDGQALAVIRPTTNGVINVTVEAEDCTPQTITIEAHNEH